MIWRISSNNEPPFVHIVEVAIGGMNENHISPYQLYEWCKSNLGEIDVDFKITTPTIFMLVNSRRQIHVKSIDQVLQIKMTFA